jgi:hypothetical protein
MPNSTQTPAQIPLHNQPAQKPKRKFWKTIGYQGYSKFLATDNDFLIFRHFGVLNTRVLLLLQDEISVLEQELEALDFTHSQPSAADIHNGSFRRESLPQRRALLLEIHKKIKEYSQPGPKILHLLYFEELLMTFR